MRLLLDELDSPTDLAARAAGIAGLLDSHGAVAGRPVAVMTDRTLALALLALAAPMLGCPLFPLDPAQPEAQAAALLDLTGGAVLVADRPPGGRPAISVGEVLAAPPAVPRPARPRPSDLALLVATSGSTGAPKAVMLTEGNLAASAAASAHLLPLRPDRCWLGCLPLFHVGGYSIVTRCAYAGAEAVLQQGFDAQRVLRVLADAGITHLSLVPAMLAQLLDASDGAAPPSLRHVLVGGAALSSQLAERAAGRGWPVQPTYGMSETASQIATLPVLPRPWRQGRVGRPLPGAEAALGEDGRLRVRGPMVMAGYANPGLVPGDGLEDGWFVTGDLAEIDADGALTILGRCDDVIVSGGKKVMPALVEEALARCPGVDAVGVVGRKDAVWGEVVTAVYCGAPEPAALLGWCRAEIAGALRPRAAIRVAVLPRLANGKPDRLALRRLAEGDASEPGGVVQD